MEAELLSRVLVIQYQVNYREKVREAIYYNAFLSLNWVEKYPKQRHARFPNAREYQWAWTACSQCDNLIAETVKEWLAQPRRKIVRGKEGNAVKRVDFAVQADIGENDTADTTQDETKELHNVDL